MTPDDAQRLLAHAVGLGLSAIIEDAGNEGAIVRIWPTAGAVLTLAADTSPVRYLLGHVAQIAE